MKGPTQGPGAAVTGETTTPAVACLHPSPVFGTLRHHGRAGTCPRGRDLVVADEVNARGWLQDGCSCRRTRVRTDPTVPRVACGCGAGSRGSGNR